MPSPTTARRAKPKSVARRAVEPRLRPQNKELLHWLDSWLATADDHSQAWWAEFEADLQRRRVTFRPAQAE